jgi:hypothetical protein
MSTAAVTPHHNFFKSIFAFFKSLVHPQSWAKAVNTTLNLLAPLTNEVVALTAGEADAGKVAGVIDQAQTDLALVAGIVSTAETGGPSAPMLTTATNSLHAVQQNMQGLLTAGHIKDPATIEKVTGIANAIIGEIDAILKEIPGSPAPAAPSPDAEVMKASQ